MKSAKTLRTIIICILTVIIVATSALFIREKIKEKELKETINFKKLVPVSYNEATEKLKLYTDGTYLSRYMLYSKIKHNEPELSVDDICYAIDHCDQDYKINAILRAKVDYHGLSKDEIEKKLDYDFFAKPEIDKAIDEVDEE